MTTEGSRAAARDPRIPALRRNAARAALLASAAVNLDAARRKLEGRAETAPAPKPRPERLTVIRSTDFAKIAREYEAMFAAARPLEAHAHEIELVRQRVLKGAPAYRRMAAETGVPWAVIGVLHGLETGFSFSRHLHNGDPLSARTKRVPAGRPASGAPPFTWEESAADALRGHKLHRVDDWSLARTLYEIERFNGFGYRYRRSPSPYLWSFSDQYRGGKFVRDGVFDPKALSRQAGAATVLKVLIAGGDLAPLA